MILKYLETPMAEKIHRVRVRFVQCYVMHVVVWHQICMRPTLTSRHLVNVDFLLCFVEYISAQDANNVRSNANPRLDV